METRITIRHFRCEAHPGISTLEPDRRVGKRGNKSSAYLKSDGKARCDFCRTLNYVDMMHDGICHECCTDIRRGT